MKILFGVLGAFALLAMLLIGLFWYAAHKVKQIASNNGIDLNGITETHHGPGRRVDACELLTKEDLSQILSLTVERADGTGTSTHSSCHYFASGAAQRAQEEAIAAKKKLEEESKAGSNVDDAQKLRDVGTLVRGITGAAGAAQDGALLSIEVDTESGKANMTAFKIAMGLTGAAMKSQGGSGGAPNIVTEKVEGVGDEAMFGPLLSLSMFRKGNVSLQIDGRLLPGGREAQIAIAKRVLSKL